MNPKPRAFIGLVRNERSGEMEFNDSTLNTHQEHCWAALAGQHGGAKKLDARIKHGDVEIVPLVPYMRRPLVEGEETKETTDPAGVDPDFHKRMLTAVCYTAKAMTKGGVKALERFYRLVEWIEATEHFESSDKYCASCGCIEEVACPGGCAWALDDPPICTACALHDDTRRQNRD